MKFERKNVLKKLQETYEQALENKIQIYVSPFYSEWDKIVLDDPFTLLDSQNIGLFLHRSKPVFLHPLDTVKVLFGEEEAEMRVIDLQEFTNKDFLSLVYKEDEIRTSGFILDIQRVDSSHAEAYKKNLPMAAKDYCDKANEEVEKLIKGKVHKNKIYHIHCDKWKSGAICDGPKCIAQGNFWDFHPGCHGLSTYKDIQLGEWRGAKTLANKLSQGLKKEIVKIEVNPVGYELLTYGLYKPM